MKPRIQIEQLPLSLLTVPKQFERESYDTRQDKTLAEAIKKNLRVITQPLVVVRHGDDLLIVKGTRRYYIAKTLGIPKVPCVVKPLPPGIGVGEYMEKLRFVLDTHRQDLTPMQRAELVQKIKDEWKFSNADVAKYLGITSDTITNWTAILEYAPEIQQNIEMGNLTLHAARVFAGMTFTGQRHIVAKHWPELVGQEGKGEIHKRLRALYPPDKHPGFYLNAADAARRLKVQQTSTRRRPARNYTPDERSRILSSVDTQESQLRDNNEEIKKLKALFAAAAPLVASALRHPKRRAIIQRKFPTMVSELEAFAKVYCAE